MKKASIFLIFLLPLVLLLYWEGFPYYDRDLPVQEEFESMDPQQMKGQENLYIVFLNGLGCYSDGSRFNNMGFHEIRKALTRVGYRYYDDRLLQYSYLGGQIRQDQWYPRKYNPRDTGQPIQVSVQSLEWMISEFSRVHPEAQFLLVGHSLGGRIALDFVSKTSQENRERIEGVITLNSPLLGSNVPLPAFVMRILEFGGHIFSAPVVKQLLWEFRDSPEFVEAKREMIEALQAEGLRVATFSTKSDVVVPTFTACLFNDQGEPLTEGYVIPGGRFFHRDLSGHMFILKHQEIQQYILSFFIEPENIAANQSPL
ncbi:alpha/beta fold hydrolase, putative [Heliorestis convoluta]|uniref:Alpha/beta fold hydrolase, putative n=2 Tax=Heliorestis convoluta TaxID=356322 RepID=A0A5Q2MYX2_9FIRM|nr:alpha/beta fold hydrolase, putative [Heliorestis convoluta]